jgi:hypothetical protein
MQRIFIKKYFLFTVGSVCRVRVFTILSKESLEDEKFEMEVRKWPRQQSKDFFAVGFYAVVMRWDMCISMLNNKCFFQVRMSHLRYISICVTYLLTLPRTLVWIDFTVRITVCDLF